MKCWMRLCKLTIGNRVLEGPPLHIEFEEDFSTSVSGGAKIKIANPSSETLAAVKKTAVNVIMAAGYQDDYGTVFTSEVNKWEYKKGQASVLELQVKDASSLWIKANVNRSWRGPIAASAVAQDLLRMFGLTGRIEPETDISYPSKSFCGCTLSQALSALAHDMGSELFFRHGTVVILARRKGFQRGYYLSPETGLLSYEDAPKGYKVRALFLYQLGAGSVAKLKTASGDVDIKVVKGTRKFSVYGDAGIEFEAVRL